MAARNSTNPDELVKVNFIDTAGNRHEDVSIPRRLLLNGSQAAKQRWMVANNVIPDPNAPELPAMEEPQELQQTVQDDARLISLEQRIAAVESRPVTVSPSEESLQQWARAAERIGTSHQELAAVQEVTVATVEGIGAEITKRQDGFAVLIDAGQKKLIDALVDLQEKGSLFLVDLGQRFAGFLGELRDEAIGAARSVAEKTAIATVKAMWLELSGKSTTIVTEDPSQTDDESFGNRWFQRPIIEGDSCFQLSKTGAIAWRRAGGEWLKSVEFVPKTELVNQQLSVLDKSSHTMTTQTIVGTGGGSGSGGEKLLINRAGVGGGSIQLATSDNWAGVSDPKAGELILDLRGLDGAMTGKSGFMVAAFTWDGTDEWTEYALIGELHDVITVELSIQRGNAVAPSGVTVTIPPGAQALRIFMRVLAKPGTSGAVNNVSVAGSVEWAHESLARAQDARTPGPQPLWIYV